MRKQYLSALSRFVFSLALLTVVPAQAGTFKTLYNFAGGNDGIYPYSGVIFVGDQIYGSTFDGGPYNGEGTLYKFDPATGAETPIYYFGQTGAPIEPWGGLVYLNGSLWGTSRQGNANSSGSGYQFNLQTGKETTLTALCYPTPGLTLHKNLFYGTQECGNPGGGPFVYSINPATYAVSLVADLSGYVYNFRSVSGTVTFLRDEMYGPESGSGSYDESSYAGIFKANPKSGHAKLVYKHGRSHLKMSVISEYAGALYATQYTNSTTSGSLLRLDPATKMATVLHKFSGGSDGGKPSSGVVAYNGLLYGETEAGGKDNRGTIFSVDPTTGVETVVYSFTVQDGRIPYGGLTISGSTFYGTTILGGSSNVGTIFKFKP